MARVVSKSDKRCGHLIPNDEKRSFFRSKFDKFIQQNGNKSFSRPEFYGFYHELNKRQVITGIYRFLSLSQQETFNKLCLKKISPKLKNKKTVKFDKLSFDDISNTLRNGFFSKDKLCRHIKISTLTYDEWVSTKLNKAQKQELDKLFKREKSGPSADKQRFERKISRKWSYDPTPNTIKLYKGKMNI